MYMYNDCLCLYVDSWVSRPVWWHWVIIHIPDQLNYTEQAVMYVGSGSNEDMK